MEIAKYILSIFKSQIVVVWSWGFHSPVSIENGIRFKVQGFKFRGVVEVKYNEGHDLFDVRFIKGIKVVATANDIYFDMLVDVIDDYVEKTENYEKKVKEEYSF